MASSSIKSAYWKGFRDSTPFIVVVIPFSTLFGVLATEAGLSVFETMTFSIVVIAGAAQLTALQLMNENAPTIVVLASALAVNLRMAMYSASLTPFLGAAPTWQRAILAYFTVDQSYALSVLKFENTPKMTLPERVAYFMGTVSPVCPNWYLFTLVGAVVGKSIPSELALDFAVPIAFLAMVGPMLRTGAHVAAALVSVILALCFAWVPYNLGLMIAGLGGMIAGAQVEVWSERRVQK